MLIVYAIPPSLYCAKLRITLRHKGLAWREVAPPGGYGSAEYKKIVPSGNLPALLDGDLLIADSEAIAEYLDEQFRDPPMLQGGAAARARTRERSRFHDTRLEPAVRSLFSYLPGRTVPPDGWLEKQSSEIGKRIGQLGRLLDTTPQVGCSLQLGDCGYPITFAWLDALQVSMGLTFEWPDAVAEYRKKLDMVPSVADELADYRPKLQAFLAE